MRNKVVVPVDLTPASKNAFLYAVEIASELDLDVELLPMIESDLYIDHSLSEDFYGFKEKSLTKEVADFYGGALSKETLETLDFDIKINMLPYSTIFDRSFSKRNDVDLVVFGIEKNNRYAYRISQNLALEVSKRLNADALFVPVERQFMQVENILFVADYDSADILLLKQWQEIGNNAEAEFHFIFGTGLTPLKESKNEIYEKIFTEGIPDISFHLSFFTEFELEDAMKSYVDEAEIDMVVINKSELSNLLKEDLGSSEINRPVLLSNPVVLLKIK